MDAKLPPPITVDEYISRCAEDVRPVVEDIRALIKECAPGVVERISYNMPGYFLNDRELIWFGVYKRHIGLYPITAEMEAAIEGVSDYKDSNTKASLRLPLDRPIPYGLVRKIVEFKAGEILGKRR